MGKLSTKEFMKDSKGNKKAEALNLKETGKLIVFFHPASGIVKRQVHWFPTYTETEVENKKGKKETKMKVVNKQFICPGFKECPICQLRSALRDHDDIDDDEVVLRVGEDDDIEKFLKGDLVGVKGYDWQKDIGYRKEYLFGAIDTANVDKGVLTLFAPNSLGKAITKVIEEQIEEEGEEDGDPFQTPYGFKLVYDDDEPPASKYSATYHSKVKVTDEIQVILDDEDAGTDLEGFAVPTEISELRQMVASCLVLDADDLDLDLTVKKAKKKTDDEDEDDKPKKKKAKDDDEDDDKPKKKKTDDDEDDKPKKKKAKDDEDEDEKPKKKKPKDDDEDDDKPKKKKTDDDEDDDKPKKKKAKDDDEDEDDKPKKKKPKDDEDEDEKPKKRPTKEPKKDAGTKRESESKSDGKKPKKKDDDDDDDRTELEPCPNCGKKIAADATKCPHCKSEFETQEVVECVNCHKEVDASLDTCPHCGEDIVPF